MKTLSYLLLGLIVFCFCCAQQKEALIVGKWQMEQDKTISIEFKNDSLYTYESGELIFAEKYIIKKSADKKYELFTISEVDTNYQIVMGLNETSLTLVTESQGKVIKYSRK